MSNKEKKYNSKLEKAFFKACKKGNIEKVKSLYRDDKFRKKWVNSYHTGFVTSLFFSKFPLYVACENGHDKVVEFLLKRKVIDVNQKLMKFTGSVGSYSYHDTSLHIAVKKYESRIVLLLLGHPDINVKVKNNDGEAAFDLKKEFHKACRSGDIEMARVILKNKKFKKKWLNSCERDETGKMVFPLYVACDRCDDALVELLLTECKESIEVNKVVVKDDGFSSNSSEDEEVEGEEDNNVPFSNTCLHRVVRLSRKWRKKKKKKKNKKAKRIIMQLLEHPQIDLNKKNWKGVIACDLKEELHEACREGDLGMVKYISNHRHFDKEWKDSEGWMMFPLYIVSERGYLDIVEFFILSEPFKDLIDVNQQLRSFSNNTRDLEDEKKNLNTCLHEAAKSENIKLISLLLIHPNIDPQIKNHKGLLPASYLRGRLYEACRNGRLDRVKDVLGHPLFQRKWINAFHAVPVGEIKENWSYGPLKTFNVTVSRFPLYIACQNGHLKVVKLLLQDPMLDVNKKIEVQVENKEDGSDMGFSSLSIPLEDRHKHSGIEKEGDTSLHTSCNFGELEIAKLLLEKSEIDIHLENRDDEKAIELCADHWKKKTKDDMKRKLREEGLLTGKKKNKKDIDFRHRRSRRQREEEEKRYTYNFLTDDEHKRVRHVRKKEFIEIFDEYEQMKKREQREKIMKNLKFDDAFCLRRLFYYACQVGDEGLVKGILEHHQFNRERWVNSYQSFKTEEKCNVKRFPLYIACQNGHLGVVKLLLEEPSLKINRKIKIKKKKKVKKKKKSEQPLSSTEKDFRQNNAWVEIAGDQSLHTACNYGETEIVKLMLGRKGAKAKLKVSLKNEKGQRADDLLFRKKPVGKDSCSSVVRNVRMKRRKVSVEEMKELKVLFKKYRKRVKEEMKKKKTDKRRMEPKIIQEEEGEELGGEKHVRVKNKIIFEVFEDDVSYDDHDHDHDDDSDDSEEEEEEEIVKKNVIVFDDDSSEHFPLEETQEEIMRREKKDKE